MPGMDKMESRVWPDYRGGGIVNLMSSIICTYGGHTDEYPELRHLDPEQLRSARNIVLLVIDGLGYDYLTQQAGDSVLRQHLQGRMTSVAPPTTATAISTFLTGLAPQQHGLTGWYTYFRELGSVLAVLPFTARCGAEPLGPAGISAGDLYGHVPVFDRLAVASYSLCPDWIARSDFNRAHHGRAELVAYRDLEQCFSEIVRVIHCHDERKYLYAYWPGLDQLAHKQGIGSAAAAAHLAELDADFARLIEALRGTQTTLIVTADHGIVDVPAEHMVHVDRHPGLKACLGVPLCGEQRLAYAYVRSGRDKDFEDYVRQHLSDTVTLCRSGDLLERNLFGLGEPHAELAARIGDYTLVMQEGHVITDRLPGERPHEMVGFHGGLSAQEMFVPLIVARC